LKRTLCSILLVVIILTSSVFISTAFAAPNQLTPVIVGFKGLPDAALIHAFGGQITHEYSIIPAMACSLPAQAVNALQKNPNIAYVEEDFEVTALEYGYPTEDWGITQIGAKNVHATNRGTGIKVGVIDTGINRLHEDLSMKIGGGWDFVNNDNDPIDDNGHGTHCAGIIAAAINTYKGVPVAVVGVAPEASIYAYKVLNSRGSGTISNIILGIQRAVTDQLDVISMSLGSTSYSQGLYDACVAATSPSNNIVVVAAAGNSGNTATGSTVNYPAKFDCVIAVGATDVNDKLATFSSTGSEVDVVAPGVRILSDYKDVSPYDGRNCDTLYMDGTSMACPHVAGTAALLLKANPSLTPAQVQEILKETAVDLGTPGFDNYYGYGRIDAAKAVAQFAPSLTVNIVNPTAGSTVEGSVTVQASVTSDQELVSVTYAVGAISREMMYNSESGSYSASWDTTPLADGPYALEVTAIDSSGSAKAAINVNVDNQLPAKVMGLSATATSATKISLSWAPNTETDLKGYNIYRGSTETALSIVAFVTAPLNNFVDTGLKAATTYNYKVTAVDQAQNEGEASSVVSATTPVSQPLSASITMALKTVSFYTYATATVTIRDTSGNTISGAIVTGQWSGATTDKDTATTNTNGVVVLQSNNVKRAGSGTVFTITITNVVIEGYTYDSLNPTTASKTK
jgi:subtilisin